MAVMWSNMTASLGRRLGGHDVALTHKAAGKQRIEAPERLIAAPGVAAPAGRDDVLAPIGATVSAGNPPIGLDRGEAKRNAAVGAGTSLAIAPQHEQVALV